MATYPINCSEIAGLAGMNPFQPQDEAVEKFRMRVDKKRFMNEVKSRVEEPEWIQAKKLCQDKRFIQTVNAAIVVTAKNTKELERKKEIANKDLINLGNKATDKEKRLVENEVRRKVNTTFGTELEKKVRERWSKETEKDVMVDLATCQKIIFKIDENQFVLRGRHDGIVSGDERAILEIKSRANKLFHTVRVYERVQVQAYCFLFDCEKAYLVEALDTGDDFEMDWITVKRDENYWKMIIENTKRALEPYFPGTEVVDTKTVKVEELKTPPSSSDEATSSDTTVQDT